MLTRSIAAAVGVVMFAGVVHSVLAAGSDKSEPAFKMYAAFTCATYAQMAGQEEEQTRLFQLGYASGKQFLAALRSDNPPGRNDMPTIVLMLLAGPIVNDDFTLGRIFSDANQSAFDKIVKEDENGFLQEPQDWNMSDEIQKIRAEKFFSRANCRLIA